MTMNLISWQPLVNHKKYCHPMHVLSMGFNVFIKIPLFCFLLLFPLLSDAACTVTDDSGSKVHLNKPAQRIISLAPDITEILFAIGTGNHVVGVISGSDYPLAAQSMPIVGSYSGIDLEKIISLHPDLIVTWSHTFSRQLAALKTFGIPVYTTLPRQLEDVPRTMKNLGCLAGTEKFADQAATQFLLHLDQLRHHYRAAKPVTVFYQIGSYSLMTVNKDSWINQVLSLCGGNNIFAESQSIAPEVSWEAVVSANPQVVMNSSASKHWQESWQRWQEVTAVKNQLLFSIHPDLIERAGPRLIEGAAQVCHHLQNARQHLRS